MCPTSYEIGTSYNTEKMLYCYRIVQNDLKKNLNEVASISTQTEFSH